MLDILIWFDIDLRIYFEQRQQSKVSFLIVDFWEWYPNQFGRDSLRRFGFGHQVTSLVNVGYTSHQILIS